jgi:SSS family solute:Na+ symporter
VQEVIADLSWIDFTVIGLYFLATAGIGVWVSRMVDTGEDLFLAGRSLTWPVIGFSLFASNISTTTLIGLAGAAYASGIAVSAYEWMAGIPLLLLAFVFAPVFIATRITTIPEYLEKRFDRRSRLYFSALTIALSIIVDTAGGLYAGAVVLRTFFPGLDITTTCLVLGVFAGVYTASGGLRAVVYTDVMQAIALILGTTLMALILFARVDFDWGAVVASVPDPSQLSMVQPVGDDMLPWLGLMLGVPILGIWYWATNQYIVQRVLGARSLRDAQAGAVMGGLLKLLSLFTMVLPGAMAIGLLPDLPNPDMVFPAMVTEILPVGVTGLVLAGLIAAIMSSVDSTLNSASTLVVHDFALPRYPGLSPGRVAWLGRLTTLVLMVIAVAWAPQIASFGGLWDYLQQAFSILVPPVVAVFVLGVFWRGGTGDAAFRTFLAGHALGLGLFLLTRLGWWPLHFTVNVAVMTLVSGALFVVLSKRAPVAAPRDLGDTIWRPALLGPATSGGLAGWLARVLAPSLALVAGMAAILFGFW